MCLEELAALVSLSINHFCRAFKQSYGVTPHLHLRQMRVELAKELMLTTSEPLTGQVLHVDGGAHLGRW